jgi:hypothetical protein
MNEDAIMQMQMECNIFFQENPYTLETCEGLALRLGRRPEDLAVILDRLVSLSIVERLGDGARSIYRYVQPIIMNGKDLEWKNI